MILTKKNLKKWCDSMWVRLTAEQERAILEYFGTEELNDWDMDVQLRNFLSCGEFVKSSIPYDGEKEILPEGVRF